MNLKCLLFGHKPYRPRCWDGHALVEFNDALGSPLGNVELCERCSAVYWERIVEATRKYKESRKAA